MITRLDRLARSTRDLLNVLHEVAQSGAAFRSLHDAWADTTTPHGRLMLTILGGLAEFERSLIKGRTDVGIKRARRRSEHNQPPSISHGGLSAAQDTAERKRQNSLQAPRATRYDERQAT
jgi:DNA invertase Pin-like site-specific DNA recombinase